MRVGLNAGEVVVRSIGSDLHMDYTAVGQTTHLAARMEQMAMPGAILITPAVLGLVEGFVQVKALGAMPVRGLRDPVEVYEVTGAGVVRSRLQAAAARGLTRFVGRQPELETLQQALAQAQAGHGQVVALVGEAGVGKSRLLYEFGHSHHTQGWLVLESASVSYGKATPYFPVVDLLKRYCHVEERDDPRTIRAKVTGQILTLDEALQATIPALLALLDALPADSPFLTLDPPQRRQRTLDGLKRLLMRESQVQPLLLVLRTCTGSIPRPRPSSTAWSRACRRPGSCCWSTTGRSTSMAGAARPTTASSGSTRCRPRVRTHSSRRCWGTTPAWGHSSRS